MKQLAVGWNKRNKLGINGRNITESFVPKLTRANNPEKDQDIDARFMQLLIASISEASQEPVIMSWYNHFAALNMFHSFPLMFLWPWTKECLKILGVWAHIGFVDQDLLGFLIKRCSFEEQIEKIQIVRSQPGIWKIAVLLYRFIR